MLLIDRPSLDFLLRPPLLALPANLHNAETEIEGDGTQLERPLQKHHILVISLKLVHLLTLLPQCCPLYH